VQLRRPVRRRPVQLGRPTRCSVRGRARGRGRRRPCARGRRRPSTGGHRVQFAVRG